MLEIRHAGEFSRLHDTPRWIYLAGPMTGLPDFNYPEFNRVSNILRRNRHVVYSPAEFDDPKSFAEPAFVRRAFSNFCRHITLQADALVVLPGWRASFGAVAEVALANALHTHVFEWEDHG